MDAIPLAVRPLVKRLESEGLSQQDLVSVIFVVRLGDTLHKSFYGTFLTISLVDQLCEKLGIQDLTLDIEVFATRWNFRQGLVSVSHPIAFDYDMESVDVLSKIGRSVLNGPMTPMDGLRLIRDHEVLISKKCSRIESYYRDFPGRGLVIPLMAASCAGVYFEGTWPDVGFAAVCGVAGGIVAWCGVLNNQIQAIADYLAAIFVAMISVGFVHAFPDSACFSAEVFGTLYWFLYGTAFVISIYEVTNNQLMAGVTRLFSAILRSYGLAFGAALGLWFSAWDDDRWDAVTDECSTKTNQIDGLWFILLFPLSGIACLFQFRVRLSHFLVCLMVQTIAYGSQYLLGNVWKQPDFFANMVPAYLATIASHVFISVGFHLKVSSLEVSKDAYLAKKMDEERPDVSVNDSYEVGMASDDEDGLQVPDGVQEEASHRSVRVAYLNTGWAKPDAAGYARVDKIAYAMSDLWFCLLPALYLLVPGSKLFQSAFTDILGDLDDGLNASQLTSLASSLTAIGLGQVVGLRLGFATLWACHKVYVWVTGRCCGKMRENWQVHARRFQH